jgi:hypothetical protein
MLYDLSEFTVIRKSNVKSWIKKVVMHNE